MKRRKKRKMRRKGQFRWFAKSSGRHKVNIKDFFSLNVTNQVECWVCEDIMQPGDQYREHLSKEHLDTAIDDDCVSFDQDTF